MTDCGRCDKFYFSHIVINTETSRSCCSMSDFGINKGKGNKINQVDQMKSNATFKHHNAYDEANFC